MARTSWYAERGLARLALRADLLPLSLLLNANEGRIQLERGLNVMHQRGAHDQVQFATAAVQELQPGVWPS